MNNEVDESKHRIHIGLITIGIFFFLIYIIARYYIIIILDPQGLVTTNVISLRDSFFNIGIIISATSLILPSAKFPKDEEKIIAYLYPIVTLIYVLGLFLNASNYESSIYLIYNSGILLIILSIIIFLGFLGIRGKRLQFNETDRIATTTLSLILILNLILTIYMFSLFSQGRSFSINLVTLSNHSLRYAVWLVLATYIMKFSKPNEKIYRSIILVISTAIIIWTLSFSGYIMGIPISIISGFMDAIIGLAFLISAISIFGIIGKRDKITPHYIVGGIAIIWFLIAGVTGIYLITFYSFQEISVSSVWRLFHLMNANWSLIAGIVALGLASLKSKSFRKYSWIPVILLFLAMIKTITSYLLNVFDSAAALPLLRLGEPFLMFGLLIIVILLFMTKN